MPAIARLSHVGFNVPRDKFDAEFDFWQNVIGLTCTHRMEGRNAFFTADGLRDHEFILFAADAPVAAYGDDACILNHVAFDVATNAEVDELTERLRAMGIPVEDHHSGRRRSTFVSPGGIRFEINTPPYAHAAGRA